MTKVSDFKSLQLKLASPDDILKWSYGEVLKPETINYRTQKPERDGLFDERIFGPEKDYECYCGKYRRIRYKGVVCDRCGVEVIRSSVRRERMAHIHLAVPVAHIWFLRSMPSRMGLLLDVPLNQLEKVIYYNNYIVLSVDEDKKMDAIQRINEEYAKKHKALKNKDERAELKEVRDIEIHRLKNLKALSVLNEYDYDVVSRKYGEMFEASTGSEPVRRLLEEINFDKFIQKLQQNYDNATTSVVREKIQKRLILAERMKQAGVRPEWMFFTHLPMIPPELRPMVQLDGGRYASSDLNDLYRRVINRNNRLKRLIELNAPEVIKRNEKRMLQEAVDALIDNSARSGQTTVTATTGGKRNLKSLADMLKGKQGRFRQNLLGKRVDYSGRSVIVVGPTLALSQCGLPKKMALELFKPFVIQQVIKREMAFNVRAANRIIDDAPPEVWAILEEVIEGKYVLLNRAPTLHRLGIQAFQPILIEGNAVQLHPLVCAAYNADFDGDQMAVHLPLSKEAQAEARTLMLSAHNLTKPATGAPIVNPTKDMVLGCFWMSKIQKDEKGSGQAFGSFEDVQLAYDMELISLRAPIKVRIKGNPRLEHTYADTDDVFLETSAGRIIFNEIFPLDFPFVNSDLSAKTLKKITSDLFNIYGHESTVDVLDAIKNLGFYYSTISGITWSMGDLNVPLEKQGIIDEANKHVAVIQDQYNEGLLSNTERRDKIIEIWNSAKNRVEEHIEDYLDENGSVKMIVSSGARGSHAQLVQMMGMKGTVVNPAGQTMEVPVLSSYKEGFTPLEYFLSTHAARKGEVDTALRTARAGYLTRRLVDVTQDIIIYTEECKDKNGIIVERVESEKIGQQFEEQVFARVAVENVKGSNGKIIVKKGEIIDASKSQLVDEDKSIEKVAIFSPLSCQDQGVCARCYGLDLATGQPVKLGEAVGIVAAQSIGEPGTQLTMRTFHTGGVASASDVTKGLPRVEEIFEARTPKGEALISEVHGKVKDVVKKDTETVISIIDQKKKEGKKNRIVEYFVPKNVVVWVEKDDMVVPGSQLTEGHIDLKKLYKQTSKEEVQKRIVSEVQQIYTSNGATIHNKHIEIVVRQMFSRVEVIDQKESSFTTGEIVSTVQLIKENERLKKQRKSLIEGKVILSGITKVALTTDSFLSAASFQETTRVLIDAAIQGKVDTLTGLKENVIIGKIIPAGTGFHKEKK